MPTFEHFQLCAEVLADFPHMGHQAIQNSQKFDSHRARQRATSEGSAMHSGMHAAGYAIRGKDRSQRQSRSQGLGHSDDVGFYAVMLIGEIAAGAAQTALDFIEDQQSSGAIRQLPCGPQEFLAQRANSPFSLNGLQADGTYAAVELPLQVLCVVECNEAYTWNQGREGMPVFLLPGGGQRTKSAPMKGILQS
jgi:hypothetical protein